MLGRDRFDSLLTLATMLLSANVAVSPQSKPPLTVHRSWATPVLLAGIEDDRLNLHRVTPTFYRSAQPDKREFAQLVRRYGIRTVIRHQPASVPQRSAAAGGPAGALL
jgi:hypothetical protein